MANQQFTLKLGIPNEYPKEWKRGYNYSCHNSDGLNNCECMSKYSKAQEDCCFFGRPIEPLAFYLPPFSDIDQQKQCPLYGVLPKEIRDLVFEYALADDGAPSPNSDNVFRREQCNAADVTKTDVACALLQTCKAVYLETYRLPMLLNGYLSYGLSHYRDSPSRPDLARIAPWQYALIQRLDFSVQQVTIEGGDFERELSKWHPILRHSGAYVAPHFYSITRPMHRTDGVLPSHNFGLTTFGEDTPDWHPEDGDKVTLHQAYNIHDYDDEIGRYYLEAKGDFTARAMVARPLTHLTIRMSRTDWWTWTDNPNTSDSEEQLALDPACGTTTRPLLPDMLAMAAERRTGQHPQYKDGTWGAIIAMLPDLKTFELILETFLEKKRQLEVVVDCAKTWKFPFKDTQYELVWDGKVEELRWTNTADNDGWEIDTDLGSAAMNFNNDDDASDGQRQDHPAHEKTSSDVKEAESDDDKDIEMAEPVGMQETATTSPRASDDSAPVNAMFSPLRSADPYQDYAFEIDTYEGPSPLHPLSPVAAVDSMIPNINLASPPYIMPSSPYQSLPIGYSARSPTTPQHSPTPPYYSPMSPGFSIYSPPMPNSPTPRWYDTATEFEVRIVRFRRQRVG